MTFDESVKLNNLSPNILAEYSGSTPENYTTWLYLLSDLAMSLYEWKCDCIGFFDLLQIEKYIFEKVQFALVRSKHEIGNVHVIGKPHIYKVTVLEYGSRFQPKKIQVVDERLPKDMIRVYEYEDFVFFNNYTLTIPRVIAVKYAMMLAKLDALYAQNIDKLSVPIVGIVNKSLKNEFLNLFKRTKFNALYTFINGGRDTNLKVHESFFNPQVEFILDKINEERNKIMKEFIQEMGVNPSLENNLTSQYTNNASIAESSLISKYFGATLNKYRNNFVKAVEEKFGYELAYSAVVKSYYETHIDGGLENGKKDTNAITSYDSGNI